MPNISEKARQMPASPIRKLVPYAEAAKKAGKKVYHLNIGQPDIETPGIAWDTLKNTDRKVLEYSHSAGFESYRTKLASYYQSCGININMNQLMITTGGSEAILFGLMSCLNPGDEVIIPEPFYANYNGFATAGGFKVVPITAKIEDNFALPPIAAFKELITDKTKAIIICNPSNPTGYLYSKEELETLKEIVLEHDLYLFADEVYREFCYDGREHYSILNMEGLEQNAIVVDSISKRFSACGARIGALVTRNQQVLDSVMKFAQARLSPPTLGQIVGEACLDVDGSYITDVIEEYVNRRNTMIDGLNNIDGVVCPNPGGAFYAVAQLPVKDSDTFCQWLLEEFSYNNETVMMAPASGFYASEGLGKQEVRIAYVLNKDELAKAIKCLDEALKVYPDRIETKERESAMA